MNTTRVPIAPGKRLSQVNLGHDGVSTSVGNGASQDKSASDEVSGGPGIKFQYPGDRWYLNLEDLQRFRFSIEHKLLKAYQALEVTDKDIAEALCRALHQVSEMAENTTNVVKTYRGMAQIFACNVLPQFYHIVAVGDDAAETCQMEYMHSLVNKMINDGKVVRSSYIVVMETVMYLATCTQVSLDFYESSEVGDHSVETGLLRSALRELRSVAAALADPPNFWLVFHMTELELSSIETAIQKLLQTECPSAYTISRTQICNSLSQISMQYLPQDDSSQWYG